MEENSNLPPVSKEALWHLDNYILIRDYYDRTISRIAARCVRMGNIAMEEYPQYGYILDVLEEISDTGDYIIQHKELYPYVEKKIAGGLEALKKNLKEYKQELQNNASPEMIKEDALEVEKMKAALGEVDKAKDPTLGAGMNMEALMEKLLSQGQAQQETAPQAPAQPQPQPAPAAVQSSVLQQPQAPAQPAQPPVLQQPTAPVQPAPAPVTSVLQQSQPVEPAKSVLQAQTAPTPAPVPQPQSILGQQVTPAPVSAPAQTPAPASVISGSAPTQTAPSSVIGTPQTEVKKIIKIRKPIAETDQAVPVKEEVTPE